MTRNAGWKWAVTSEDEWYKAAYHKKNDGITGGYFDYPTNSVTAPGYVDNNGNLSNHTGTPFIDGVTDPGNYATYDGDGGLNGCGSPYYRTKVGEWEESASPYDTFDQGGNVWEWNESILYDWARGMRGGSCFSYTGGDADLLASSRDDLNPTYGGGDIGFRVVSVPEPGGITLLLCGLLSLICWRRRQ